MSLPTEKILTFSILVEKYPNDAFVAHSLETGLVATARDESDVLAKMGKLLVRQVEFALKNDRLRDVYHPAPKDVWDKFLKSEEKVVSKTRRTLQSKDHEPNLTIDQTAYAAAC